LRSNLSGDGRFDLAAGIDGEAGGVGRHGDAGLHGEAVLRHDGAVVGQLERAIAGIGGGAVRQVDLEKAAALERDVERIVGHLQVALLVDAIDRDRLDADADLHAGRNDRAGVGGLGADAAHVLIEQVRELGAAALVAGGGGVRDVVRDHLDIHLLGEHACGGGGEGAHGVSPSLSCWM
jgi:hypothetical protein